MTEENARKALEENLERITRAGVQVDRTQLKKDMISQFSDFRLFIRELIVNSADADASYCMITGRETEDEIELTIIDDGHGMDRAGVKRYCTLFDSSKKEDPSKVGFFGVGKASVAKIPGQRLFQMTTSTGSETWRVRAGNLLADEPIVAERVEPVQPKGTRIAITFAKERPLVEELGFYADILMEYCCYLPMDINLYPQPWKASEGLIVPRFRRSWFSREHKMLSGQRHEVSLLDGHQFDIVLEMDNKASHLVYQKRVLVTSQYNLVSQDLSTDKRFRLPFVSIRVDSTSFELPFGRHAVCNEELIELLAEHIRLRILPRYYEFLHSFHGSRLKTLSGKGLWQEKFEEITVCLMEHDHAPENLWCAVPVFTTMNGAGEVSLNTLRKVVAKHGALYLAPAEEGSGLDFDMFLEPVLAAKQPGNGSRVLQELFGDQIVNLGLPDLVLEAPAEQRSPLSPAEEKFQRYLGFDQKALEWNMRKLADHRDREQISDLFGTDRGSAVTRGNDSEQGLRDLRWRLGHLVARDRTTPCVERLFLLNKRDNHVVLNLHHPQVIKLIQLSELTPSLASHLALALCLTAGQSLLEHLSAEERQRLIILDGIAKCGSQEPALAGSGEEIESEEEKEWSERAFRRRLAPPRSWDSL